MKSEMTTLYVQFADDTGQVIASWVGSPQDPKVFPNQGTVESSDARWKTYYDAQFQQVQAILPKPDAAD